MKLRNKTLILISFSLISLIAVLYASLSTILLRSFAHLEIEETQRNVKRVQKALEQDIQQLNIITDDWASWDDTYKFMQNNNETYIEDNLGDTTLSDLKLNVLVLVTPDKKIIYQRGLNLESGKNQPISPDLFTFLSSNPSFLQYPSLKSSISGMMVLSDQILMLAAQPILTSNDQGPIQGSMIMGRYLNQTQIEKFSEQTQLEINIYQVKDSELDPTLQKIVTHLKQNQEEFSGILVQPIDRNIVRGYTFLQDIQNQSQFLLEVTLPRDIYKQGQRALRYLVGSLMVAGGFFGGVTVFLLEKMVLWRLERLSKMVRQVGEFNDLTLRIPIQGNDELSFLGTSMNQMLARLEEGAKALALEREKVERLLLNVLPESIADKLKKDQGAIAEHFDEVTILFADIVGFTPISLRLPAVEVVNLLNYIFSAFDELAQKLGLEKIKTIGDAYMVAAGLPLPRPDHAEAIAEMALAMLEAVEQFQGYKGETFQIRVGINTGVVVAGVIGTQKFIYDLWGDTVNVASRMESHGEPGKIQVTEATYQKLKDRYDLQERGIVDIKGRGSMITYWLIARKPEKTPQLYQNV